MIDITDEEVESDLSIDNSSIFTLEKELLEHPKKEAKYSRLSAMAIKEVEQKELELEILVAELMESLETLAKSKGQPIAQSARGDIKKQVLPLLPQYKDKRRELITANSIRNVIGGAYKAMQSRNYKLSDILEIKKRELFGPVTVRQDSFDDPMSDYRRGA